MKISTLAILALSSQGLTNVASQGTIVDNFNPSAPFDPSNNDPYFYFANPLGGGEFYVGNDADIDQQANEIIQTAEPFEVTIGLGPLGGLDHVKTLQYRSQPFAPGNEGIVSYELRLSGSVSLPSHPFPPELVSNPEDDLRLASLAMNILDLETFIVADFFLTNTGIWAFSERLPFGWTFPDGVYAAYSQVKRVADRTPDQVHDFKIQYDKLAGEIRWYVENTLVLSTNTIGTPMPEENGVMTLLDHGGTAEIVSPNSFFCGWGQFTLLDMTDPNNSDSTQGLVRLSDVEGFYVKPASFWDVNSEEENRLFGQGVTSIIQKFKVGTK